MSYEDSSIIKVKRYEVQFLEIILWKVELVTSAEILGTDNKMGKPKVNNEIITCWLNADGVYRYSDKN